MPGLHRASSASTKQGSKSRQIGAKYIAPVYQLMNVRWLLPLAALLCGLLTIERAWSRDHATSSVTASATRHHLRTIQMIVENVYVWLVGPRCPVSGQ